MDPDKVLLSRFKELFGGHPRIFRAPGRVNLIGEHTDYNDGFVMPAAIQFATYAAVGSASSSRITVHSENVSQSFAFELDETEPMPRHDWTDYVRGVAVMIQRAGRSLSGANLVIRGDVPLGAGLSSSASLEVAVAFALLGNSGQNMDRTEIALLCRRAENDFVRARVGIMDQFIACHAQANHALLLDCRSLKTRQLKLPENIRLAVSNTMVKHELAASEYNKRREECEEGVAVLSGFIPEIKALRDLNPGLLEEFSSRLDQVILRRCRHVVTENARVLAAAAALERTDLSEFGRLMYCSHRSLRDDYEVSCRELDIMVDLASRIDGVYGSRMTGGGFGGCTITLLEASQAETFAREMYSGYLEKTGIRCEIYICSAAEGAGEEPVCREL